MTAGTIDYGRDICDRCELVIEMPPDGGPSAHLCIHDPIPWDDLFAMNPHLGQGVSAIRMNRLVDGRALRILDRSSDELDSARTGPYPPGTTPAAVLVGDLLLWTIDDLHALPGVGRGTIAMLQTWLMRGGYMLRHRDDGVFRTYLVERLRSFGAYHDRLNADLLTTDLVVRLARYKESVTIDRSGQSVSQRQLLAVPPFTLPAGNEVIIGAVAPHELFLDTLYIPIDVAERLSVTRLSVGTRELLSEPVPAILFSDANATEPSGSLHTGEEVRIGLRNDSASDVEVQMALLVRYQETARGWVSDPPRRLG